MNRIFPKGNEMRESGNAMNRMTRREFLQAATVTAGGLAIGGAIGCTPEAQPAATTPAATATSGGTPVPKKGGTLVIGYDGDVDTLDPAGTTSGLTARIARLMLEHLVELDAMSPPGKPQTLLPALASSWQVSTDGLTYTFKIRDGVKFHDGTPVDAEAVKFNYDRCTDESHPFFNARFKSVTSQQYRWVKGVEAVDPKTVRFILRTPFADFITAQFRPSPYTLFVSPTAMKKYGVTGIGENPVGTGPFRFVEWQKGQRIVLERNPDYYGAMPNIDKIIIRPIAESAARQAALDAGEVDINFSLTPDLIDRVKANSKQRLILNESPGGVWYWILNTKDAPTADKRVRQAMNYAVNWERIAKDLMKDTLQVATQPMAPDNFYYDSSYRFYTYDPAKAKALLKESGVTDLKLKALITNTLVFGTDPLAMNQLIQANLKDVGIEVTFEALDFAAFAAKVARGTQPDLQAAQTNWTNDLPYALEQLFHSSFLAPSGPNRGYYKNEQVDALLEQGRGEQDDAKRRDLYRQAQRLIVEDGAWLCGLYRRDPAALSNKVKGPLGYRSVAGIDFRKIWLE